MNEASPRPDDASHWSGIGAVLLVFLLAIAFHGTRGIWEPDEGRYTVVALEILRTGD